MSSVPEVPLPKSPEHSVFRPNAPRYAQLAQTLINEIESGHYPLGALLPTEFELCAQFGVSRSTAREALKRLVQLGMVVRQARIGTTVCARSPQNAYRQHTAGVADLYQYATDTTLVIEARSLLQIDQEQAHALEATAGETWLHLTGRRHSASHEAPLCVTEIWVHPAFRSIQGLDGALQGAVHASIESQFGESIAVVEQEISAVSLDRATALALSVPFKSPGLWISRRYRNRMGQLIELAESTHAASRFSYTTTLRRDWV